MPDHILDVQGFPHWAGSSGPADSEVKGELSFSSLSQGTPFSKYQVFSGKHARLYSRVITSAVTSPFECKDPVLL
jgi:hypothetical protein